MENQHRKIKGYRELSQTEIDLRNGKMEKTLEQLALDLMGKSDFINETWESFSNSLAQDEYNFDVELAEFERIDVEAQNIAQNFFVR